MAFLHTPQTFLEPTFFKRFLSLDSVRCVTLLPHALTAWGVSHYCLTHCCMIGYDCNLVTSAGDEGLIVRDYKKLWMDWPRLLGTSVQHVMEWWLLLLNTVNKDEIHNNLTLWVFYFPIILQSIPTWNNVDFHSQKIIFLLLIIYWTLEHDGRRTSLCEPLLIHVVYTFWLWWSARVYIEQLKYVDSLVEESLRFSCGESITVVTWSLVSQRELDLGVLQIHKVWWKQISHNSMHCG